MSNPSASTDASAPLDRVPFFQDFSCRQRELEHLGACFRATLVPDQLGEQDRLVLGGSEGADSAEQVGLRPLALVGGASGMGKSRLSNELKSQAAAGGAIVKEMFCFERQGVPFLPILRVVKELISESPSKESLWETHASVLARVFPELAQELGDRAAAIELPGEDGRIQLFDSLYRLLGEFSRERPLLILIHDLHRADQGTVDFLQYLARNVFLDERGRRREPEVAPQAEPDDAWKHIRRRSSRPSMFITDTLEGEGRAAAADGPVARIMVVANYLQVDEDSPATDFDPAVAARLAGFEDEPHVLRLSLHPLDRAETENLIRRTLGGRSFDASTTDRLHEHTGGNPFRLVELCRCLFEGGLIPTNGSSGESTIDMSGAGAALDELLAVDADASRIIAKRLASLETEDARIVRLLAALRRPVQSSVLVALTGGDAGAVAASVTRLLERDFICRQRGREKERFYLVHEDYVRVAYGALEDEERQAIHAEIADGLAGDPRAIEPVRTFEIYEHYRRSSSPLKAVPFGIEASLYFSRAYAVDLASKIATGLLDLTKGLSDGEAIASDQHWDILELSGRLELRRGEVPAAKGHIKRLLEYKDLDESRRLGASLLLAEIYRAGSESHKGIKALNRALKQLPNLGEPEKARIATELARLRLDRQDPKRASNLVIIALKDLEAVEEVDTSAERIGLLEVLADSHLARREIVSAIQIYQQLLELVEEHGDASQLAETLSSLGRLYYDRGNYFRAARYLFRALDAIRRVQDLRALSRAYDMLGKVYRNSGDTLRGIEYFHRSLRLRERVGDTEGLSPTLNSLGSLYSHRGEYVEAIRYFQRSVEISERVGDTAGIVRAFLHLGRSYLDVGELRQVESLAKQILILSQEFNLVELEGEGHRLQGDLALVRGDLKNSERELRKAVEIATKRGRRGGEGAATLSFGALLNEKEEYEAALKQISKGQLLAEEIQSVPLQVRAQLLKGNVYRFLKGGNNERAKECFRRGLELVSGENQLPLQWELDYSISKVFQSNLEFVEAAESYRRAQRILDRIVARLPEDMRVTYTEDRRRKTFYDDYRRFEKEASGRMTMAQADMPDVPRQERVWKLPEKPAADLASPSSIEVDKVFETAVRLSAGEDLERWSANLLNEARKLVPAPCGFLMAFDSHGGRVLAECDMGADREWSQAEKLPGALAREVARTGVSVRSGDDDWLVRLRQLPEGLAYKSRSLVAVPLLGGDTVAAVLYLERPSAQNPFDSEAQRTLERLTKVVVAQFSLLGRLDGLCRFRGSSILTAAGFDEFLPRLTRAQGEGAPFAFLEIMAPGLEAALSDPEGSAALAREIAGYAEEDAACVAHVTDDTFVFGYVGEAVARLDSIRSELSEDFARLVERVTGDGRATVGARTILVDERTAGEEDLQRSLRARVFRRRSEFDVGAEIGALTGGSLTLKEAKTALEKRYITAELQKSRGNITRAAESLGVHRPQLSNLIKKYNVRREDFE